MTSGINTGTKTGLEAGARTQTDKQGPEYMVRCKGKITGLEAKARTW